MSEGEKQDMDALVDLSVEIVSRIIAEDIAEHWCNDGAEPDPGYKRLAQRILVALRSAQDTEREEAPSDATIKAMVGHAQRIALSANYKWPDYMRDLWSIAHDRALASKQEPPQADTTISLSEERGG